MIRPCDNCGGSGISEFHEPVSVPCPVCVDIPRLPNDYCREWARSLGPIKLRSPRSSWYFNRQPFKPDRSTGTRWCSVHEASMRNDNECLLTDPFDPVKNCEAVWIKKPEALEEVAVANQKTPTVAAGRQRWLPAWTRGGAPLLSEPVE